MRKPFLLLAATFLLSASALSAPAQVGVYGMATFQHMSGLSSSPLDVPGVIYNDNVNPGGFVFGAQYDTSRHFGLFTLGADVRASRVTTVKGAQANFNFAGAKTEEFLGGVRGTIKTPRKWFRPYVLFDAGLGRSNYGILSNLDNGQTNQPPIPLNNSFAFQLSAGGDVDIASFLAFRFGELSYGGLIGGGHDYPILSYSVGVVLHLPVRQ